MWNASLEFEDCCQASSWVGAGNSLAMISGERFAEIGAPR